MKHFGHITRLLGLMAALAVAACTGGARDNQVALSGGIGGTGVTPWEGGIGGTGVVGTITGFGSIIVNGLHVHYDVNQVVESAVGPMTGANFAIGQVVAAETRLQDGKQIAVRLIAQTALAGPVENIDPATGELRVLGETVHIMPGAVLSAGSPHIGDNVVVSGHRGTDGVYASRVDPTPAGARTAIGGTITAKTGTSVTLDNRHVIGLSSAAAARLGVGDYVGVTDLSTASGGGLLAHTATRFYGALFDGRVTRMAVEGLFSAGATHVPGVGPVANIPTGRAVVFVTQGKTGALTLDGATQRPTATWRQDVSINNQAPASQNGGADTTRRGATDRGDSGGSNETGGNGNGANGR